MPKAPTETDVFAALNGLSLSPAGRPRRGGFGAPELVAAVLTAAALVCAVAMARLGFTTASLVSAAVFLLVPALYVLWTLFQALRQLVPILGSPTRHLFHAAGQRVELKRRAVRELRRFPPYLLASAEQALAAEVEAVEGRAFLLVGILEKTGLIPAAVALYLGYLQYLKNGARSDLGDVLFLSASILYISTFLILAWKQSLRDRLWLLQRAME